MEYAGNMPHEKPLIKGALWNKLSTAERARFSSLNVQYAANKKVPANRNNRRFKGVSLEMLQASGMIGADPEDGSTSKFVADIADNMSDVISFVQTLPALHAQVLFYQASLQQAVTEGSLSAFGEENTRNLMGFFSQMSQGLDLYRHCSELAPAHAVPEVAANNPA